MNTDRLKKDYKVYIDLFVAPPLIRENLDNEGNRLWKSFETYESVLRELSKTKNIEKFRWLIHHYSYLFKGKASEIKELKDSELVYILESIELEKEIFRKESKEGIISSIYESNLNN